MPSSIFINNIEDKIPTIHNAVINELVNEGIRSGILLSKQDAINSVTDLQNRIKDNKKFFSFIPVSPGQIINSEVLNSYFKDIKSDLTSIYASIEDLSSYEKRIGVATKDDFIKTRAAILEVINKLTLYNFLKDNPEYQDAKFINFNNSVNNTLVNPKATIDTNTRSMKLSPSSINRYSQARFNLDSSKAEFKILGGGIVNEHSTSFGIENTLDSNPNNFWTSLVMCNGRPHYKVRTSHSSNQRFLGSGRQDGNTYESNGIVAEIVYSFSKTIEVNNIKLLPIADYPLYIIDIAYKISDASDVWLTVPGFNPTDYQETLDWIEWIGRPFYATAIKLTIEQANYNSNTFMVPKALIKNNQLWDQLLSSEYSKTSNTIELNSILTDKISVSPKELSLLNEQEVLLNKINRTNLNDVSNKSYEAVTKLTKIVKDSIGDISIENDELVEINKLFFNIGLRSVEFNSVSYDAFSYYESPKFESNANILEVSIDTVEKQSYINDSITGEKYQETSIEYEIELSDKTSVPILPINTIVESNGVKTCIVKDELLQINRSNFEGITRFPIPSWIEDNNVSIQIRKNGQRIPVIVTDTSNIDYRYNYTTSLITNSNGYRYIKVTFNDKSFDIRASYTISYIADESASIVDLNAILASDVNVPIESYSNTDKDNSVKLSYYPYIEYEIINNTGAWSKVDQQWVYNPSTLNYNVGRISIDNSNSRIVYGTGTSWLSSGVNTLVNTTIFETSGASLKIIGDNNLYRISGVSNESGLTCYDQINTGFLNGSPATGLMYVIGKTEYIDNKVYGLDNSSYEPIKIYVNNIKALNKTDYELRQHEAFSNSNQVEYLQIGKKVYFNKPLSGKIDIDYSYLTKFIKVNAILRSHKNYNSKVTPILYSYTLRIKNNKL